MSWYRNFKQAMSSVVTLLSHYIVVSERCHPVMSLVPWLMLRGCSVTNCLYGAISLLTLKSKSIYCARIQKRHPLGQRGDEFSLFHCDHIKKPEFCSNIPSLMDFNTRLRKPKLMKGVRRRATYYKTA